MKKNLTYSAYCLLFFLLLVLSACSPLTSSINSSFRDTEIAENCDYDQPEETAIVPVESEQDLEEELAGLAKVGDWESGIHTGQSASSAVVYDFPVVINPQVEFYLNLFQNRQKKYFKRWLERSTKYLPAIRHELRVAGLPQDLAYLAMIESGYNPSAYSHAHAAGLWQFIRGTGRNYGLRIDSWVDERREPEKATKAAVAYLGALYERFGDWQLAVAGYNAGEGKIERAIKKYNSRDFWELAKHSYLRLETKRYVPKLIAAIVIARNPEQYGFTDIAYQQPVAYDTIKVPARTDLHAIAALSSTSIKTIRKLNNELRKSQTPPGSKSYLLKIPVGSHDLIAANITKLRPVVSTAYKTHVVCKGESISRISRRYKISMTTLLKANNLRSSKLKIGQRLRIPYKSTSYALANKHKKSRNYGKAPTNGQPIIYSLRKGETLAKVGKRYNVPVDHIVQWNAISDVRRIRAGRKLTIYLDTQTAGTTVASAKDSGVQVVMLADVKKRKPAGGKAAAKTAAVSYYKVRNGDSLWTIAKKFQVSARDLRRWNGLRNNMIHPGSKLVIKKS